MKKTTKKILLVYLPFCTPASPPYSITYLYSFLKSNCNENMAVLDLNLEFHKLKFPKFQQYFQDKNKWDDYEKIANEYHDLTAKVYSENNKKIRNNKNPEFFSELIKKIKDEKPDLTAFSIVYSSQAFYAYSLLKELKKDKNIKTIIGGPSINKKLESLADKTLHNEVELLNYIAGKKNGHQELNCNFLLDFSSYNLNDYFTPKVVIPIKTSNTCYYKGCSFCTHFSENKYYEFPLEMIKETIINSNQKYFFLIDDMIHSKRLLEIAEMLEPLNVRWTCQLKPTKDFNLKTLKKLRKSGLTMIIWGVESGNQRILNLMNKSTKVEDVEKVLKNSHFAGIKNVTYIMFGFPSETKEELIDTINFLKKNKNSIDLVSTSIFGLHQGTKIYNHPKKYGITKITEEKRTLLEAKIGYQLKSGLTQQEASKLRNKNKKILNEINKFPNSMNFFREHMFCSLE